MADNFQLPSGVSLREKFSPSRSVFFDGGDMPIIRAMKWDAEGRSLLINGSQNIWFWDTILHDKHYQVKWDIESGETTSESGDEYAGYDPETPTELQSPNGFYHASLSAEGIELRQLVTGQSVRLSTDETSVPEKIAFSNDSRLLLALVNGHVSAWRSDTGKLVAGFGFLGDLLAVNPARSCIATAFFLDDVVQVWELNIDQILTMDDLRSSPERFRDADVLKLGVDIWNWWRKQRPDHKPNFSRANLSQQNLSGADFSGASFFAAKLRRSALQKTNLSNADLSYADVREADLSNANLKGARLVETFLTGAKLHHADLRQAVLLKAELTGAEFKKANFAKAKLGWTVFGNNDLADVVGLATVRHEGPSDIGLNTLYSSKGELPVVFLKGCGLPQSLIDSLPALLRAADATDFASCFISYTKQDEEFASKLYSRLREANIRVWFAPEDIESGKKLYEQIYDAILKHDRLLIVLSKHSLESEWVMTEIRKARQTELQEKRRKLFPIRLVDFDTLRKWECFDADSGRDLAAEVRAYFIPDFSAWRINSNFEVAFKRLLKDLRSRDKA